MTRWTITETLIALALPRTWQTIRDRASASERRAAAARVRAIHQARVTPYDYDPADAVLPSYRLLIERCARAAEDD